MDTNKTHGEKARLQLHKNVASNIEQVRETAPHKSPAVRPSTLFTKTIKIRRTRHAGHCWRSRDEIISDILLWTPSQGRAKAGRPAWSYIQQLCADTWCNPKDRPKAMDDRKGLRERVRNIWADSATWWWWYFEYFKVRKLTFLYYHPSLISESFACLKSSSFFRDVHHFFLYQLCLEVLLN